MVEAKDIVAIGGTMLGALFIFDFLKTRPQAVVEPEAERAQTVTTSGIQQTFRPRTTFDRGNGGSVRELTSPQSVVGGGVSHIMRLPEDHGRGEAVLPTWRRWEGHFGSIRPGGVTGTFNGRELGLVIPEVIHVTPQLEARVAWSVENRRFEGGGTQPPVGTFG